jgi:SAM-dependent methyltransferase
MIVLDLGCGEGTSKGYFQKMNPEIRWRGFDLESSPEVDARQMADSDIHVFDGVHIPCKDDSIDLIYCKQVLEHVERPIELMREVNRVLKPGAYFVGSASYLEPFHSLSICNFTPYGFTKLLKESSDSLRPIELRPGIDFLTLLLNRLVARRRFLNRITSRWFEKESPFNQCLTLFGKMTDKSSQDINLLKLLFCGHFVFLVQKADK